MLAMPQPLRTLALLAITLSLPLESPFGISIQRSAAEPPVTLRPTDRPIPEAIARHFVVPQSHTTPAKEYRSPLLLDDGSTVKTPEDWARRRGEIRQAWDALLGQWPEPIADPRLEVIDSMPRENFTQHRVRLRWVPNETTQGYLLIPTAPAAEKRPAVISVYYEPETAIGMAGELRDFAYQLAKRGFVTLSLGTTEATKAETYGLYHPSLEAAKVEPLSMLAYAASTARRALASRPEVDPARIGIVGHSFGGKWALFASCLDEEFACAAWSDPGIMFQNDRSSINYWEPWYLGYHPKPWRKRGLITPDNPAHGAYPKLMEQGRNLHELHALMAPRPFLVSGGSEDPESRWGALAHTIAVNRLLGFENRVAMTNRPDHSPNAESNEVIYRFFEHFLPPPR